MKILMELHSSQLMTTVGGRIFHVVIVTAESRRFYIDSLSLAEDPLRDDPVFQRQVIACQLVPHSISPGTESQNYKTVGGRTVVVKKDDKGTVLVNDVPLVDIVTVDKYEVWILKKLLFIRPEDIEVAVGRVRGDVK